MNGIGFTLNRLCRVHNCADVLQVFPTRKNEHKKEEEEDMFYVEVTGRYFLLIVAHVSVICDFLFY